MVSQGKKKQAATKTEIWGMKMFTTAEALLLVWNSTRMSERFYRPNTSAGA